MSIETPSSPMDPAAAFMGDGVFGSLRIDPINYDCPVNVAGTNSNVTKFSLPSWADFPGKTNGVLCHELSNDQTTNTFDLDRVNRKYYLFGRAPKCPCKYGKSIIIKSPNASRQHFAIVHSKYEALYIIDLGSIHGTFIGEKRIQCYHPIPLINGCIISMGNCKIKFLIRIFVKQPAMINSFAKFCKMKIESFDEPTKIHTHVNQVPDLPSPSGNHLIKPSSFYKFSSVKLSPLIKSPEINKSNEGFHVSYENNMLNRKKSCLKTVNSVRNNQLLPKVSFRLEKINKETTEKNKDDGSSVTDFDYFNEISPLGSDDFFNEEKTHKVLTLEVNPAASPSFNKSSNVRQGSSSSDEINFSFETKKRQKIT